MNDESERALEIAHLAPPERFLLCFVHDHLKEVTRIQCQIIESAILNEYFISRATANELRVTAATYLDYASQIEQKLEGWN